MTNYERITNYDTLTLATFLALKKGASCECCIFKKSDEDVCITTPFIKDCFFGIYHWLLQESEEK